MDVKIKKRNKEEYVEDLGVYIADCLGASEYIEDRIEDVEKFLARLTETLVSHGKSRLEVELEIDGRLTC